jgi:branched-chain amino acid transport system ATP-binding protein
MPTDPPAVSVDPTGSGEAILVVDDVSLRFGGIDALRRVSLTVHSGEIVALIGPNGAGKTSLLNVISRLYQPTAGRIVFHGRSLLDVSDREIARLGIGRTFQNLALFPSLTVLDNVTLGYAPRLRHGLLRTFCGWPGSGAEKAQVRSAASSVLAELGLGAYADRYPEDLPQGILRQVELARALVLEPSLLLLDEPAAGLAQAEIEAIDRLVRDTSRRAGVATLLIEHRMDLVMSLADRIVVLDFGEVIASGPPDRVCTDERVLAAYLGAPSDG